MWDGDGMSGRPAAAAALLTDPEDSDVALLELANLGNRPYMVEELPVRDRAQPAGHSGK